MALDVRSTAARPVPGRRYDCTRLDPGTLSFAWELDCSLNTIVAGACATIVNRLDPGTGDLVQVNAGERPVYEATGWGGLRPSMKGDSATLNMICDGAAALATGEDTAFTILVAQEILVPRATDCTWSFGNSGAATQYHRSYEDGAGRTYYARREDAGTAKATAPTLITAGRHIAAHVCRGTTCDDYINGVADALAQDINVGVSTFDQFTVMCKRTTGTSNFSSVRIGAIWAYSGAISADQVQVLTRAMAARWPVN